MYANIGGLLAGLVGFVILVVSYVVFSQKVYVRSDYLVIFLILNIAIAVYLIVSAYYRSEYETRITL